MAVGALGTVVAMREPPRQARPRERVSHLAEAWRIVRHTLLQHARLRAAVALSVTLGLSTFVIVWLIQPYMQSRGIPEVWFGPLWALANLHVALMSLVSARVVETFGRNMTLLGCCSVGRPRLWGTGRKHLGERGRFHLRLRPRAACNHSSARCSATLTEAAAPKVMSLNALLFRLGFVVIGPPVGILVDRLGLEAALALVGVVFTVATLGCLTVFRRAHAGAE